MIFRSWYIFVMSRVYNWLAKCNSSPYCFISRFYSKNQWLFNECDLSEMFVRGWGPGGQSINTTANCVVLKHEPTGIMVKCQDSRELEKNRELARRRLNDKLDVHFNGENSRIQQIHRQQKLKENQSYLRSKKRLAAKQAFKKREGLEKNLLIKNDMHSDVEVT
ncbi:putative peptide chain release factor C12orf65 isoform 1 [Schistosoma japonicum]|uniref:Putative peptide chain release factor C12orf65 isoform 1 n=1 Tax=Schistosoma japonicum TaxID=6182 RepID=Q5DHH7_SCHJA|nr:SJCHGC03759 protein [Schistosoma japonicum]KAH8877829.1 putative peptide chain release factor C12orf65 like, mitochondrial [Schistosoma japonicum]TNN21216.1 putative peptide chain release factor C12orf65 isoform 1 [Schistosoma japonicum]